MDPKGLYITLKKVIDKIPTERVEVAMMRGAERGITLLKTKRTPVDTGIAKNAWQRSGNSIVNHAPYIGILERGARPHAVSQEGIEAIAQWVWRHRMEFGLSPKPRQRVKRSEGSKLQRRIRRKSSAREKARTTGLAGVMGMIATAAEVMSIAHAIAWKIRHKGQKPLWIVRDVLKELAEFAGKEVMRELIKALKEGEKGP